MDMICTWVDTYAAICNGTLYKIEEYDPLTYNDTWFWIYIVIYMVLLVLAAVYSGLSLGLLSLDTQKLQLMKVGGLPKERKYANKLLPLIKKRHLLLVTLLLGNTICLEAMPMLLDKISNPLIAVSISVTVVLILGEIFPQALFARHGAVIGATLTPFVYMSIGLMFIIAYPVSKLLDCMLGVTQKTLYRRAELKALVNLHESQTKSEMEGCKTLELDKGAITRIEFKTLQGVLDMHGKTARHAMLTIDRVFMLNINDCLDENTMIEILKAKFSRIPIYETNFQHVVIVGVLMVKSLINVDVSIPIPFRDLLDTKSIRPPHFVPDTTSLFDLLNHFKTGKNHLSIVHITDHWPNTGTPPTPLSNDLLKKLVIGIITLEDVIEEMLQDEILDELDICGKVLTQAISKTIDTPKNKKENITTEIADTSYTEPDATTPLLQHDSFA